MSNKFTWKKSPANRPGGFVWMLQQKAIFSDGGAATFDYGWIEMTECGAYLTQVPTPNTIRHIGTFDTLRKAQGAIRNRVIQSPIAIEQHHIEEIA